jgi:uncharacterized protein (DUF1499 family)
MRTLRRVIAWMLGVVAVLAVALLVAGQLGALRGQPPAKLGVSDGRLTPPSNTPNSVSSQAVLHAGHRMQRAAMIAPLPLRGTPAEAMQRLRSVVQGLPGASVVTQRDDYLYVQFSTRWLGFVDDAEFWADPAAGVIQVRSASRMGRKDFDVNRQRIEAIRARLAAGA